MAAIAISSGTVIALITIAVVPIAAISFARAGRAWSGIGGGRFSIEQAPPPSPAGSPRRRGRPRPAGDRGAADARGEGLPPAAPRRATSEIDVDAEVARLLDLEAEGTGGGHDEALRAEVRTLVIARNERRVPTR